MLCDDMLLQPENTWQYQTVQVHTETSLPVDEQEIEAFWQLHGG